MVAITATDTQHESKEDPNPPSETVIAHRNALADLADGPNNTPLPTDYDISKQDHDAEVQREWDQVASDIWANSSGNMAAINVQSSEPENSNEGASQPKQERERQSSSHGLGIQVEALDEEEDEIGVSSTAYSSGRTSPPKDGTRDKEKILKLSPTQIQELISSPDSVPVQKIPDGADRIEGIIATVKHSTSSDDISAKAKNRAEFLRSIGGSLYPNQKSKDRNHLDAPPSFVIPSEDPPMSAPISQRPHPSRKVTSSSAFPRTDSLSDDQKFMPNSIGRQKLKSTTPGHLDLSEHKAFAEDSVPSPMPQSIPLPPLSIPAYLELELSSSRPSPLYIHRSVTSQIPYESSAVKLERLLNFILLPPALEQVLWFGAIACLDAWLHSFTILPLRFIKALYILVSSWVYNVYREVQFIATFIINGVGRVWRRHVKRTKDIGSESAQDDRHNATASHNTSADSGSHPKLRTRDSNSRLPKISTNTKHRRQKSTPSALQADDKADILKGFLIICTCVVLSFFDASRMYHWIRGQNAIKLYVIYNVLEVGDRLLSAIGQDVLECLFSQEALARGEDGRSKVVRPFWLFLLALAYTTLHAMALFYQVITLNVAVNSYSNALITLLLSNQFVEIKSAVFKKFEKENLFQMTCADVVERFQLWLMLTIIASRNIVETGAFTSWFTVGAGVGNYFSSAATNSTPLSTSPRSATSILPQSFTFLPSTFFSSLTGGANSLLPQLAQVLGPFLIVLGSEMMVDWLKHAYIAKFNNIRPAIYGRFLDVLAKDYYTNAFVDQNLTKRLGLAVIPMACLFFRVSVQAYQMFLQALLPMQASATEHSASLTAIHEHYSNLPQPSSPPVPFTIKTAMSSSLGRLSWAFNTIMENAIPSPVQSVTFFTIVLVLTGYLMLLIFKLTLGILLLSFSRSRYKVMKEGEQKLFFGARNERNSFTFPSTSQTHPQSHKGSQSHHVADANWNYIVDGGRRVGGWGVVEVGDDKRRWIYADDPNGLRKLKSKERGNNDKNANKSNGALLNLDGVRRYEMVAKRIW